MQWLEVHPDLLSEFPDLRAIITKFKGINIKSNNSNIGIDELISNITKETRSKYTLENLKEVTIIKAYRSFFWKVGIDPTKTRPAAEALIRRILAGKPFPKVNPLVDAYNLSSIISGVPIAAFDTRRLNGDLKMRRAVKGESFLGIGMENPQTLTGVEVVVEDEKKLVAIYPYRDADYSKVTENTMEVTFLVCGVPGVGEDVLESAKKVLIRNVTNLCQGTLVEP
ncbi:MAG: phenylalanine--tRNA ligase beta subunit-related protein [Nitrososphaeria archaeon]